MAHPTPMMNILVDQTKPFEEIQQCIVLISLLHPHKQLEILKQTELWLGEEITRIEEANKQNEKKQEKPQRGVAGSG